MSGEKSSLGSQKNNKFKYIFALIFILVFPWLTVNEFFFFVAQTFCYTAIAVIGLNLLLGLSGQMSLGQAGFYALGAYGSALTSLHFGWPLILSIIFGTLVAAVGGLVVGTYALRTRGLYLAMTTLAFGYVIDILAQRWVDLTGGTMGLIGISQFEGFGPISGAVMLLYVAGLSLLCAQVISDYINETRIGRGLRAIRESEVFAASVGIQTQVWKTLIFGFSAALAGLGGALFVHQSGYVGSDAFTVRLSIALLIAVVIGGLGSRSGPIIGTLILLGIVELIAGVHKYGLIIYGSILLVVLLAFPKGASGILESALGLIRRKEPLVPDSFLDITSEDIELALSGLEQHSTSITLQQVSKSYSGVKAVDKISIDIKKGQVHGLIGPNGAGKSTVINMIAGIYVPDNGRVLIGDKDMSGLGVAKRAQSGLVRTFQNLQLIEGVSVLDNVLLGVQSKRGEFKCFANWLMGQPTEIPEKKRALSILRFLKIAHLANRLPSELPYGHRKLLELARAIAQGPRILLLDEPVAGMNSQEAKEIASVITRLRERGVTILLVEHNMEFVMSVCDQISVLNFGQLIAQGTPTVIQSNPDVIAAYFGTGKEA
jgi:ABC-type branched-subunit amino acid transport system ATPase component/ABC-type branched-subunit amino acid transport system permease subunit